MDMEQLRAVPLFSGLTEPEFLGLVDEFAGRLVSYGSGEVIVRCGDPVRAVGILVRGRVRAVMEGEDMKRLTVDLLEAPMILASAFVFSDRSVFPVTVESMEEVELLYLNRDYFLDLLGRYPSIMLSFVREISNKAVFLSERLSQVALQDLRTRLLGLLRAHGQVGTQEEMAMLLGVARPSLARVLSHLQEEGLVCRVDGRYSLVE